MTTLRIFFAHRLIGEHGPGATVAFRPGVGGDDLVVTNADGTQVTYPTGSWHGGGHGIACAGSRFDPNCPNCTGTPAAGAGTAS